MAKLKEDNELKELQSCSFKPKINNTFYSQSTGKSRTDPRFQRIQI
jgi:hypothetical protein